MPYKRPSGSRPQQGVVGPSLAPPRRATTTTWRRSSQRTRPSLAPARRRRQRSRLKVCEKARAIVGTPMFRALVTERRSMSTRPRWASRQVAKPTGTSRTCSRAPTWRGWQPARTRRRASPRPRVGTPMFRVLATERRSMPPGLEGQRGRGCTAGAGAEFGRSKAPGLRKLVGAWRWICAKVAYNESGRSWQQG